MNMDLIPGLPDDMGLECLVRVPYQHFSSVSSVCRSWKREIELPEFCRHRKASGLARNVVVLAQSRTGPTREQGSKEYGSGPVYRLVVCEPEAGYWAGLPAIPGYPDGLPMFCQVAGAGSRVVVLGGLDPVTWVVSGRVFVYDFVSATWRRGAHMMGGPRLFFACASDRDRMVFVAGGHDGDKNALRSALAYDVADDRWVHMPDMATERDEPKGVFLRGEFHVIGGYATDEQGRFGTSAESFNPKTWRWGPVQENFLDGPTCPKNYVDNGDREVFVARGADVAVRERSTWRVLAEVPCDVRNTVYVTAWQEKVMVIGSEIFCGPYKTYVLDLKSCKWERIEAQEEYSGHVQSGCCLEL